LPHPSVTALAVGRNAGVAVFHGADLSLSRRAGDRGWGSASRAALTYAGANARDPCRLAPRQPPSDNLRERRRRLPLLQRRRNDSQRPP
jgi:hypothetical protein